MNNDGYKEVLTIEVGKNQGVKYWLFVPNGLKNRGVKDILLIWADLKTIYQAPTEEKALEALERVTEKWSEKYPNFMKSWKQNLKRFQTGLWLAYPLKTPPSKILPGKNRLF